MTGFDVHEQDSLCGRQTVIGLVGAAWRCRIFTASWDDVQPCSTDDGVKNNHHFSCSVITDATHAIQVVYLKSQPRTGRLLKNGLKKRRDADLLAGTLSQTQS